MTVMTDDSHDSINDLKKNLAKYLCISKIIRNFAVLKL